MIKYSVNFQLWNTFLDMLQTYNIKIQPNEHNPLGLDYEKYNWVHNVGLYGSQNKPNNFHLDYFN